VSTLANFEGLERDVFIETGTNSGDTLWNAKDHFKLCFSIEVDPETAAKARVRFKDVPNVAIFTGRSQHWLRFLMRQRFSTTFWLDAHYFHGLNDPREPQCPLMNEIRTIMNFDFWVPPIVLIDDACMFDDSILIPGYGSFWETEYPRTQGWRKSDWPRIKEIDALIPYWTRTLKGSYFKYEVVE
jgi:hypothetical protein